MSGGIGVSSGVMIAKLGSSIIACMILMLCAVLRAYRIGIVVTHISTALTVTITLHMTSYMTMVPVVQDGDMM
jgi:hypothetical protein